MSKFPPTTRSNDCPVCGDISGNCRSSADDANYFQCLTNSGAAKFEIVNGFKHIGSTKDGLWGQFVLEAGQPQKTFEQRQQNRLDREAEAKRIYQAGLGSTERHAAHTALLAQLTTLHPSDRADSERRGLSAEAIESFRSVEPGQTLDLPINSKMPGVGFGGRKLLTRTAGYLVPAYDLDGNITGFQIRNRAKDGPKYPWLSAADSNPVNLQNGEMPLTVARGGDSSILYFAEGILKPLVAAEKLGINIIGASGGNFASSPEQLRQCISALLPKTLVLCPDAGAVMNAHVMRSYSALNDELMDMGYQLKVLWYGQATKDDGDVDEITAEEFAAAEVIGFGEFLYKHSPKPAPELKTPKTKQAKADRPIEVAKQLTDKEEKRQSWLKAMAKVAGLPAGTKPTREAINTAFMSRQLLPAHHTEGTYQPLALAPANERLLYLLDGQKGTRKTSVASKSLMDAAKAQNQTCLVIVPSRLLSRDASRVLEAHCHLDSGAESASYLVTCPESLYKFAHQQWDVVIVDECNEDVLRTFDGSLGVNPDLCQRVLEEILKTASTIAIANDQMYRPSVQAVQRLSGILPQETKTIQRKRTASELAIHLYLDMVGGEDSETEEDGGDLPTANDAFYGWLARLVERIEAGEKVAIPCGSQTRARILDRTLRAYFRGKVDSQGRKFKGQVLDGQHTPTKVKSEFASDPDQWLARVQPHWLIWTPCFNSGVSIESNYFDAQFEALSVFEGANAASQRGERVRAVLGGGRITERHVFISNRGLSAMPDPAIFTAGYWRKLSDNVASAKAEPSEMAFARSIGAEKFLSHHKAELIEKLDKKPELFEYWAIQARELFFKLETLQAEWLGNGWSIEEGRFTTADAKRWKTVVDDAKQSIIESKSRALAKAKAVQAEGQDLSPYAAVRAKKHYLGEQLSHEYERLKDAEFLEAWEVAQDDSGGIKTQRINALIKMSVEKPELWAIVLKVDTLRTIAAGIEIESLPTLPIPAKEIAAAKLLVACPGLVDVALGTLEAWDKTSQIVKDAAKYLIINAERLATLSKHSQRILGLQFTASTPIIKAFHKALQMAGLTANAAGRTNKLWSYRLQTAEDCQQKIGSKESKGQEVSHKDKRNLFRAETLAELQQQISQRLLEVTDTASYDWQAIANELAALGGAKAPQLAELKEFDTLMWRLTYCQSANDYKRIKRALQRHNLDFDSQCWAKLPAEAQQRIHSYLQLQAA